MDFNIRYYDFIYIYALKLKINKYLCYVVIYNYLEQNLKKKIFFNILIEYNTKSTIENCNDFKILFKKIHNQL